MDAPAATHSVTTLTGQWQIAAIDGRTVESGAILGGGGASIGWAPDCAGYAWNYVISGESLQTQRRAHSQFASSYTPPPGVPPPAPCPIGLPPGLADAANVLDAARRIERSGPDTVRISGGGHTVTLRSQ